MIYRDRWYTIIESSNFPVSGEINLVLGPSTILFHASANFSSALVSLMNYSIVPGLTLEIRIQKINTKHTVDIRYNTSTPDTGFIPELSVMDGGTWRHDGIIESVEYNTICKLSDIRDTGGSMNPWIYMYIDSSMGYMIGPGEETLISVRVLKGWYDITDKIIGWQWSRSSGDYADDLAWNIAHSSITTKATISYLDLGNAMAQNINCVFTIQAVYEDAAITTMFTI